MPFSFPYPTVCDTGGYNELIDSDGEIRQHWRVFFQTACQNGENKFPAYAEQTARLMSAEGAGRRGGGPPPPRGHKIFFLVGGFLIK